MMKVTILGSGTSQGVPVIACDCEVCRSTDKRDKRLRCSAMIEIGDRKIVIDAGPDFRYQMLRAGVKDVRALLLTHEHKDHIGGLDDIRAFNWVKQGKVDVYSNRRTVEAVKRDYAYAFEEVRYPGVPDMDLHVVGEDPFYIDEVEVVPLTVMHYKLPVTAFRIGGFAYITDANYIPEEGMRKLEGVECLVIDALRRERHLSHFSLEEALEVIRRLGVKRAFLTHVGHQMGLTREVERTLPANVRLAYDGLTFEV
ncbi:MAG: MBL fold metallo-hydrolase [Marinifilaceae bacterium]|nr:MBL fold metallo-hydrolase [Marinifilaceae bacterium]